MFIILCRGVIIFFMTLDTYEVYLMVNNQNYDVLYTIGSVVDQV